MSDAAYLDNGTPYLGQVFENEKGVRFGEMDVGCPVCAGTGRSFRGPCRRCGGAKTVFDQVKVYDEAGLAKLNKTRDRRRSKKQEGEIARQDAILQGHQDCAAEHADLYERAVREKSDLFLQDLLDKSMLYGGLNDAQIHAMRRSLDALDAERNRYSASKAIGAIGEAVDIEVECVAVRIIRRPQNMKSDMVDVHVHEMRGDDGSAVLFSRNTTLLVVGQRIRLCGTVAKTDDTRGYVRTMIASPEIHEIENVPAGP